MAASEFNSSRGFPPVSTPDAEVLVLGSLPGVRSISAQQYYAHPQNAFWRIMDDLFGIRGSYSERCAQLVERRIALWDVLESSVRPGSMDADIDLATATPNDFAGFFAAHPAIRQVAFNGKKAEQMFRRFVLGSLRGNIPELCPMPSTSPAFASMSYAHKLQQWRKMATTD